MMENSEDIILQKIYRKIKSNNIEVEDLFEILHKGGRKSVDFLTYVKTEYNWADISDNLILSNGNRRIPFATWADIICLYLEKGISALIIEAEKSNRWEFAIDILEEIKTEESFDALNALLTLQEPVKDERKVLKIIAAMNFASFKDAPNINKILADKTNNKILTVLDFYSKNFLKNNSKIAACLYSLRGIGDESTIEYIKSLPLIKDKRYFGLEKLVINSIKKRIKKIHE